jgi:hypothetical protein
MKDRIRWDQSGGGPKKDQKSSSGPDFFSGKVGSKTS